MAYQHHPNAPDPGLKRAGTHLPARVGIGLVACAAIALGAWSMTGSSEETAPAIAAARVEPAAPSPQQQDFAAPAPVATTRTSETVRGSLVMPNLSQRPLTPNDLQGLSREQLQRLRAETLARHGEEEAAVNPTLATNLRLIAEAEAAR